MTKQITVRRLAAVSSVTAGVAALVLGVDLTGDAVVLIRGGISGFG